MVLIPGIVSIAGFGDAENDSLEVDENEGLINEENEGLRVVESLSTCTADCD